MTLPQPGPVHRWIITGQDIFWQIRLDATIERVLVTQPVIDSDGKDIRMKLVVRIAVHPREVVHQTVAIGNREKNVLGL